MNKSARLSWDKYIRKNLKASLEGNSECECGHIKLDHNPKENKCRPTSSAPKPWAPPPLQTDDFPKKDKTKNLSSLDTLSLQLEYVRAKLTESFNAQSVFGNRCKCTKFNETFDSILNRARKLRETGK